VHAPPGLPAFTARPPAPAAAAAAARAALGAARVAAAVAPPAAGPAALLNGLASWYTLATAGPLGELVGKRCYSPEALMALAPLGFFASRASPLSSSSASPSSPPAPSVAPPPTERPVRDDAHVRAFDARQRRQERRAAAARRVALNHPDGPLALIGRYAFAHRAFRGRVRGRARARAPSLPRREFCPRLCRPASHAGLRAAATIVAARANLPVLTVDAFLAGARDASPRPLVHRAAVFSEPSPVPLRNGALLDRLPPTPELAYLRLAARYGFDTQFSSSKLAVFTDNSASAYANSAFVDAEIAKGLTKGWFVDVTETLTAAPNTPFIAASLSVASSSTGKLRLISNMSAPFAKCVNDTADSSLLPPAPCATPASIARAVHAARALCAPGERVVGVVADVAAAYRQLPIPVSQWWAHGFLWGGRAYVSTVVSFGLRPAAQLLHRAVAPVLVDIATTLRLPAACLALYVDDSLTVGPESRMGPSPSRPQGALGVVTASFRDGGLPVSDGKSQDCTAQPLYTGWRFDFDYLTMAMPLDRLDDLRRQLLLAASAPRMPLAALVALLGRMTWAARGLRVLGAMLWPLHELVTEARRDGGAHRGVAISPAAADVLHTWARAMSLYNGVSLMEQPAPRFEVFSDAAGGWGWGWVCHGLRAYGFGPWPVALARLSINVLESLALLAAASGMDDLAPGAPSLFRSDNTTAVAVFDHDRGRHDALARLGCRFAFRAQRALHIPRSRVRHIPGAQNTTADALSRGSAPPEVAGYTRHFTPDATLVHWVYDPVSL